MQEFFRGLDKDKLGCAEANSYLAEDRVMCLEIYIKTSRKYYLAYIPDAKAFTDAPPSISVLLK